MVWRILVAFERKGPGIIQYRRAIIDGLRRLGSQAGAPPCLAAITRPYRASPVRAGLRPLSRITRRLRASPVRAGLRPLSRITRRLRASPVRAGLRPLSRIVA